MASTKTFESIDLTGALALRLEALYGERPAVSLLRYSVNKNYLAEFSFGRFFVRVYRPRKKRLEDLLTEHEYLRFLKSSGAAVIPPLDFPTGTSIENFECPDLGALSFSLFEFVEGAHLAGAPQEDFLRDWGRRLGDLQRIGQGFRPPHPLPQMMDWTEQSWIRDSIEILRSSPIDEGTRETLLNEHRRIHDFLHALPRSASHYGIIQGDYHYGNTLITSDHGLMTLDFDEACRTWFVWDLTVPMYKIGAQHMVSETDPLVAAFLDGYREKLSLPDECWSWLRVFQRIRHFYLIGWLCQRHTETKWKDILPRYVERHTEYLRTRPDLREEIITGS